jgi:hypothetical protein
MIQGIGDVKPERERTMPGPEEPCFVASSTPRQRVKLKLNQVV